MKQSDVTTKVKATAPVAPSCPAVEPPTPEEWVAAILSTLEGS